VDMNKEDRTNGILIRLSQALKEAEPELLLHVVLTGGTTGNALKERLGELAADLHPSIWDRVHLWWGDERFLPLDSTDRNDCGIQVILGGYYSPDRVHRVHGSDTCDSCQGAAIDYSNQLLDFGVGGPNFTIVMLSLGADGHVASLFPFSEQLAETAPCVAVMDAPKPPPERVTLTFTTLNRTQLTLLFAVGATKQQALLRLKDSEGSIAQTPGRGINVKNLQIIQ